MDWIDQIRAERLAGWNRPLTQAQHNAVNARYPGLTIKHCPACDAEIDDCKDYCSDECEAMVVGG